MSEKVSLGFVVAVLLWLVVHPAVFRSMVRELPEAQASVARMLSMVLFGSAFVITVGLCVGWFGW